MAEVENEQRRKNKKAKKASGGKETIGGRWPAIKPKKDIQLDRIKGTHLFTIPNFLSAGEAKAFIDVAESLGFTHQGSLGPTRGEAFRDNHRISVNDPELAQCIWESGLNRIFEDIKIRGKSAAGLNPNIRFYRYTVGQRFGRHIDESVYLENGNRTHYTLLIYLSGRGNTKDASSDSLVGGETVFYDQGRVVAEVAPVEGMALLHLHGDKCMLHEARVVSKNVKYILRSDVAFA
ncbi:hypothetical protein LUZ63_010115 [Rhynchospora breviuscula]|uniref:Fe2OG dioxygenase domain-containing protein n=1 Tax=Rhynchospora breviuscula TaxID=2022672 RepID=A0A9Q0HPC1_9POAL|nr:hypothetical protein LUZ63_010115 [Rhynchospora breviuscula]